MFGLSAAFAFVKSIPGMIVAALVVAALGFMAFLMIEKANLETSLAKTQAAAAVLKQSNTSLELDNKKKQQEFNAAIAEQQNITKNDQDLTDKAQRARTEADRLKQQQEAIRTTGPEDFIKQVNRDIGCDFQGFGKAMTCATVDETKPARK